MNWEGLKMAEVLMLNLFNVNSQFKNRYLIQLLENICNYILEQLGYTNLFYNPVY